MNDQAPPHISKDEARHPSQESIFSRMYPQSPSFGQHPQLVTVGEGRV